MNLDNNDVKAIICNIHAKAVEQGENCQQINMRDGPSKKIKTGFYSRQPSLKRSAECVGHGRINMANNDTRTDYFKLSLETLVKCDIVKLDSSDEVIQESMKQEEYTYNHSQNI